MVAGIADTGIPCWRQRIAGDAAAVAAVAAAAEAAAAADAGDAIRRCGGGMAAMGRARADPTRRHWTPQLYNDPACPSHDADDSRGRSFFRSFFLLLARIFLSPSPFSSSILFGLSSSGISPPGRRCPQHSGTVNLILDRATLAAAGQLSPDARLIRSLAEPIDRAPRGTWRGYLNDVT